VGAIFRQLENIVNPSLTESSRETAASADKEPYYIRTRRLADLLIEVARSLDRDITADLPRIEGDPKLEALRSVILEKDRVTIEALKQKFEDPSQFAEAISAVLASAFALADLRDEHLARAMAPALERAAQASIRKNPDNLLGVLYPLMGPAIRKSMAENLDGKLQRLNQAFKHSFSWQGLKWRMQALRTGSSFADVVLKYTVEYRVEHIFLIHRKTGLPLEHIAATEVASQDPQLVSGMLTAIQDFVRDSFEGTGKGNAGGIDTLRLGDLLLWCEQGPHAFLAAVIRGNPPESLHAQLRETLSRIHENLRIQLEEFEGDNTTLGNMAVHLEDCLQQQQQQPRETKLSPWLWGIPLALLLIGSIWMVWRGVDQYRINSYVQRLREEPGVVVTGAERHGGKWVVSGLRDPLAADPAKVLAQSNLNPARVVGHWESYEALSPAIVLRRLSARLNPPPSVTLSLDGETVRATGSAPLHWFEQAKAFVAAMPAGSPEVDLSALTDIQDPTFLRLRDALQAHVINFDSNAPKPAQGEEKVIDAVAAEFRELLSVSNGLGFTAHVMISGHADATGNDTSNLALSAARAEVVRSMLKSRGIAPELLSVRSAGPLEPLQPGIGEKSSAINRRVTFSVTTSE
jgi:OOP family OmpA-OmpF porin